ncbi:hypothetical protein BX592_10784 [Paraburkholderia rhizosphaerae]|uniref:DUF6396 domain-containing protein n=1 Tax=Paraburkholderia rhizosphaerae TaxID=480658 RepID=A0A4R8LXV8_9BURK|nr:hypothetical protein BX592_10784 [Paraburkholderia rhizosphaerae]
MPGSHDIAGVHANVAFTCAHEADRLPMVNPEADALFRYGRYLQTRDGPKNFDEVARYYRIAAAHGHYKANHNVQQLVSQGMANSPDAPHEAVDLASQLVSRGIPMGYYDIGYYLNSGYGLKQNRELALKYMRKAADLGNAEAQYYIASLLSPRDKAPDIARKMRQCAADQGHGLAAVALGIHLKQSGKYHDAVVSFQKGVAAGDGGAALFLQDAFLSPSAADVGGFLDLPGDQERSKRYGLIQKFIGQNELNNPKVPDIDKIVPLPPAQLPPWDGTFEWERERANIPAKPSDDLVNRLAQEKNLDPATGLPLSGSSSKTSKVDELPKPVRVAIGTTVRAGAKCPESGIWCTQIRAGLRGETTQRFRRGEAMPMLDVYEPRIFAWLDSMLGKRRYTTDVIWTLTAYEGRA